MCINKVNLYICMYLWVVRFYVLEIIAIGYCAIIVSRSSETVIVELCVV